MAVKTNRPYFEFLRRFLKTAPYEELIDTIESNLEKKGIKTDVFRSRWLHQFVVCMWTSRRRKKLANLADPVVKEYPGITSHMIDLDKSKTK